MYAYKAFYADPDRLAQNVNGTLPADSPRQAREILRQKGLTVEHISQVSSADNAFKSRLSLFRRRDSRKATIFARELATLLSVGTPLTEALQTLASQSRGAFRAAVLHLREKVLAGSSLASAMGHQAAVFDDLFINLVGVGEDSGTLDTALDRIAVFRERRQQMKGKLGTALLYPLMVLVTAISVSVFLMTYVVPSILQPLLDQGRSLPLPTRIVKATSDFLISWGWLAGVVIAALIVLWILLLQTKRGRRAWDSFLLRLPLIGSLIQKSAVVRLAIVMETLLQSGVVFVRAMAIARQSMPNAVLKEDLARCEAAVSAGLDIAPALQSSSFPPLVVQVFSLGQQSGRLEDMLARLGRDYDEQMVVAAQRVASVLEPILILILAFIVATIALATMLPILEAGDVLT